jgi:hypothetical protein
VRPRAMVSRYHGKCKACGGSVHPGDQIKWAKYQGVRECPGCAPLAADAGSGYPAGAVERPQIDHHDMAVEDQMARAAGVADGMVGR